jgi:hypothetical protein
MCKQVLMVDSKGRKVSLWTEIMGEISVCFIMFAVLTYWNIINL